MPEWLKKFLDALKEIKGHLITIGFILTVVGGVAWTVAKPYASDFVQDIVTKEGLASAHTVEELKQLFREQSTRQQNMNSTLNSYATDQRIIQQQIQNLEKTLERQDQRSARDMQEIRRLLLNR